MRYLTKFLTEHNTEDMGKPSLRKRFLGTAREITMVMVGILLALQVNNWAGALKEGKEEHRLLLNFRQNLQLDIHQLDSLIDGTHRSMAETDTIMDILNNPNSESTQQFIALQSSLLFNYYFYTNDGAYWEASSTGKIELIEKLDMRRQIFEYYRLAGTTTNDDEVFETNTTVSTPNWIELVGATKEVMLSLIGKSVTEAPELNLKSLARNPKYLSILISVKAGGDVQIKAWQIRRKRALALIQLIDGELKRWD